jgi:c(7)-type cytochrome triheme protein
VNRRETILAIGIGVLLAVALVSGCTGATRRKVLSILFDGVVQDTPPPTRRVRRDLLREIEGLKQELARARAGLAASQESATPERTALEVEQVKTWVDAAEILPKAPDGTVDWMQALRDGSIAPRSGPRAGTADQPILPVPVERVPASGEMFKVVFSHEAHTAWVACPSCHPAPFAMEGGATPMSMAQINAGELCGVCHGTVVFPATACGRCHPAMAAPAEPPKAPKAAAAAGTLRPIERASSWAAAAKLLPTAVDGTVDWMQALRDETIAPRPGIEADAEEQPVLPSDVERVSASGEMFNVVFTHEAHTTWVACPSCHPAPFAMEGGATPMSMEQINAGEGCGVCHGTVAFAATACAQCHPAMAGE